MKDISTYIPISKAKSDLLDIIRRPESVEDAVAVTKNGVPAAVILSIEKYEGLLETLDILGDEKTMKSLRASMRQARQVNDFLSQLRANFAARTTDPGVLVPRFAQICQAAHPGRLEQQAIGVAEMLLQELLVNLLNERVQAKEFVIELSGHG